MEPRPPHARPPAASLLLPPAITLAAVAVMLLAARIYDSLPLHPPPCGFRAATGLPCLGCGGTRAMRALAGGDVGAAFAFNPLVVLAVGTAALWMGAALAASRWSGGGVAARRWRPPLWAVAAGLGLLFAANWLYLWRFLPE